MFLFSIFIPSRWSTGWNSWLQIVVVAKSQMKNRTSISSEVWAFLYRASVFCDQSSFCWGEDSGYENCSLCALWCSPLRVLLSSSWCPSPSPWSYCCSLSPWWATGPPDGSSQTQNPGWQSAHRTCEDGKSQGFYSQIPFKVVQKNHLAHLGFPSSQMESLSF